MKEVYPIFIAPYNNEYLVYVPDWEIYTEGKNMADAICMARDAIGLKGIDYEDDQKAFPKVSRYDEALQKAKTDTEIFDYTTGILTMVDIDFTEYRRKRDNRMVKKNCTIPYYLNVEAEKLGINFSKLLQDALMQKIGI
ncbi:MAG: type II toxin-antitoxin system HicB family antitoxin [Eubacterium sp.]|nr:type II toxin-antitoxin system HicB family antitoxin [Eubacterium sp.]